MNKMDKAAELGQALWLDFIRRSFVREGELKALVDEGLRGVTSNPSIFEKAIANSDDYDRDIARLVSEGATTAQIYQALVLEDIGEAADVLRPVYYATDGQDGYVSIEVDPNLAHNTDGTVAEAQRFFAALHRPNILIKVPATDEGVPAIETLISEGINVNVTLIFSKSQYEQIAQAYLRGLERRLADGHAINRIASVASFFLSRVDGVVDAELEKLGNQDLQGKIAIANAKAAYARFGELYSGERWQRLTDAGARVQRPLWASTSTKNANYPDTMYVDELIGPHTVNTLPPATLDAFLDHGKVESSLGRDLGEALDQLWRLDHLGIDLEEITQSLQDAGVQSFADAFQGLAQAINTKSDLMRSNAS